MLSWTSRARVVVPIVIISYAAIAYARPVPIWTYEMMWAQSDVVVIGEIGGTRVCENKDEFFPEHLDCLQSTIKSHAVLKGDDGLSTLEFVHFKYKGDAKTTIGNGPTFPLFRAYNSTTKKEVEQADLVFMFFLKEREDGRYGPVTGKCDAVYSVARIDGFAFPPHFGLETAKEKDFKPAK